MHTPFPRSPIQPSCPADAHCKCFNAPGCSTLNRIASHLTSGWSMENGGRMQSTQNKRYVGVRFLLPVHSVQRNITILHRNFSFLSRDVFFGEQRQIWSICRKQKNKTRHYCVDFEAEDSWVHNRKAVENVDCSNPCWNFKFCLSCRKAPRMFISARVDGPPYLNWGKKCNNFEGDVSM